jgi:hypothetical protein
MLRLVLKRMEPVTGIKSLWAVVPTERSVEPVAPVERPKETKAAAAVVPPVPPADIGKVPVTKLVGDTE